MSAAPAKSAAGRGDDQAARLRALVREMTPYELEEAPVEQRLRDRNTRGAAASGRLRLAAPVRSTWRPSAPTLAIASGKGGVGKTNLSVNLCIAMAQQGRRVTLLDGDIGLANADLLCGLHATMHLGHVLEGERKLEEILLEAPGGFLLAPGSSGAARFAHLAQDQRLDLLSNLTGIGRGADALVIDCGAGLGAPVLSLVSSADVVLIVTTPEPTSIADAYALIKVSHSQAKDRGESLACGLLVNQVEGASEARAIHHQIASVCERFLGLSPAFSGWVRSDPHLRQAVRARTPLLLAHPRCEASRCVRRVAADLSVSLGLIEGGKKARRGVLERLFGRR